MNNIAKQVSMTPLSAVSEAFEDLGKLIKERKNGSNEEDLRLDTFCKACSLVSVLFGCLGFAFKFAELEYVAKVRDLVEASKTFDTLQDILDVDVANGNVKTAGSHSRNLRRVRQGLDLIRVLFEQFLLTDHYSLKEVASTAYAQVCAPYHTWAVRTAVYAGMYALPSRDQLLLKLNESNRSAEKKMRRYINASLPVIKYIDKLYLSRNISLDW
ncbi:Accelerated cell death 11 [Quillaja saponaria]|uniref:Accelerated cell death 11 n=1 Tax=Quillaja saponaria TaxID=32244 RepID=A0AAD7PFV4_QUISA|nr:Accelerated cell death 11 [Quillaja saponaria]